ncbi:biotin-dependent carboxyltransferase family protein [Saccharopolyspora sp. HNM0983]|uniref:Biotin-dependent carboxyltransferase family protein n=1 Tax=Saccharopolyspora montiporae TaxID=2781240 RepID=A0A929BDD9_9PSEU|nr:biotin-dependent carboxyltransferase family protein [Saccharopolyspora sp. HNM0983]MBE9375447.1 biotin-dependent carboxyltransferase family protein [Saccharopolyspora sp. HNM0983]
MSKVIVRSGGVSTTVQDSGRDGQYAIGMPPSGAMDQYSYAVANDLVGNPPGAAALEATYLGPELEFTDSRHLAVTGADCEITINGETAAMWQTLRVGSGDVLKFKPVRNGARPYIAVSGGVDVPPYLGSRSTYMLTGIGGFEGRSLTEGDRLPLGENQTPPPVGTTVPESLRLEFPAVTELRFVIGLCAYRLTEAALESFLGTEWKITKDADRVGYRLRGGKLDFIEREQPFGAGSDPANVVDLGYPVGSVQIPGGDEPIVLLNDAVTGGGYATIGTVISVDRDRIAQARTGTRVSFAAVDIDAAMAARQERRERLEQARSVVAVDQG